MNSKQSEIQGYIEKQIRELSNDSYYESFLNGKKVKSQLKKNCEKLIVFSNKFFKAGTNKAQRKNLYIGIYIDSKSNEEVVVIKTSIDITEKMKAGRIWLFDSGIEKREITMGGKKVPLGIYSLGEAVQEQTQLLDIILFVLSDNPDPDNPHVFECKFEKDLIDLRGCFEDLAIDTIKFFLTPIRRTPSDSYSLSFKYSDINKFSELDHNSQNLCISFSGFSDGKAFSSASVNILDKDQSTCGNKEDKLVRDKKNGTTFYSLCLSEKLAKKLSVYIKRKQHLVQEIRKILPEHSKDNVLRMYYNGVRELQKNLLRLVKKNEDLLDLVKGDIEEVSEDSYVRNYLDKEVCNGILRLLYNFAKDGLKIFVIILDAYNTSPLLFWGTLSSFFKLYEVFREIQGNDNLINLEKYIKAISEARNNEFHGVISPTVERLIIFRHKSKIVERKEEFRYFGRYRRIESTGSQSQHKGEKSDGLEFRESFSRLYGRGKDRSLTVRDLNLNFRLLEAVLQVISEFDEFLAKVKKYKLVKKEEKELLQKRLQALEDTNSSLMKIDEGVNQGRKKRILERSLQVMKNLISIIMEDISFETNGKTREQFIEKASSVLSKLAHFFMKIHLYIFSEDPDEETKQLPQRLLKPPKMITPFFEELEVHFQNEALNEETRIFSGKPLISQKKLTAFLNDSGKLIQNGDLDRGIGNKSQRLLLIREEFKSLLEEMSHILSRTTIEQKVES